MDHLLKIQTSGIQKDGKDDYFNHRYEPTPYEVLDQLFDQYTINKEACFIDYGCGKGRLNFYIEHRFHCKTKGIEYNPEYYQDACHNLVSYTGRHRENIEFFNMAAQDYKVTREDTIFYFFNPFSPEIFMSTIGQIQASLYEAPRKITILLYYPDYEYTYYLDSCTEFTLTIELPIQIEHQDERECFMIYQNL